jgi:hypothetical protein
LTALVLGALWVLAAAGVAMLPMPRQMAPGLVLLIWIGMAQGWIWLAFGLFAFLSMFRKPLRYFARRAMGRGVE